MYHMNDMIVKLAKKLAMESTHKFRVGAVVYHKDLIVGQGFNKATKTHPKSPHPYKVIDAEFAAVIDAVALYRSGELRGHKIYVHRILKDGSDGLAKPCAYCQRMIEWVGIRPEDVMYSVSKA